jgi:hypothetical protein
VKAWIDEEAVMEAEWVVGPTALRVPLREPPDWRQCEFAEVLNRSLG